MKSPKMVVLAFVFLELLLFSFVPAYSEYAIEKGAAVVEAFEARSWSFSTPKGLDQKLIGFYNVSNGEAISAVVLDEGAYVNWRNNRTAVFLFSRTQTTYEELNLTLVENERYYLILDNTFSSTNKTVDVKLSIRFVSEMFRIPIACLFFFMPMILYPLLLLINHFSKKEAYHSSINHLYFLLFFVVSLGFALGKIPPISMSETLSIIEIVVGSVVALVALFVSVTALRISRESKENTEKMMKAQLLYEDRKRAIDRLLSILKSEKYSELISMYNEFKSSPDWFYIPGGIRKAAIEEINELVMWANESNPEPGPYSEEELDALLETAEESRREDWEKMDQFERFNVELGEKVIQTKRSVERSINEYLEELSKE